MTILTWLHLSCTSCANFKSFRLIPRYTLIMYDQAKKWKKRQSLKKGVLVKKKFKIMSWKIIFRGNFFLKFFFWNFFSAKFLFLSTKFFFLQKFFLTKFFFWQIFFDKNFLFGEFFFDKIFFRQKFFFLWQFFCPRKVFLSTKIFLSRKFFFVDANFFCRRKFFLSTKILSLTQLSTSLFVIRFI